MRNINDRQTLKGYFRKGSIPTEAQFASLVDSVPNIAEDGQAVRTADGWSFYPETGSHLQIRLHASENEPAAWTLCLTPENGLAVRNTAGDTVAEIDQNGRTVLPDKDSGDEGGTDPDAPANGEYLTFAADREWHNLMTVAGRGFRMYDVFLLLHDTDTGAGTVTRAAAFCTDTTDCRIVTERKHWWGWSGGVRLRWQEQDGKLRLQVRSRRYRTLGKIYCRIR